MAASPAAPSQPSATLGSSAGEPAPSHPDAAAEEPVAAAQPEEGLPESVEALALLRPSRPPPVLEELAPRPRQHGRGRASAINGALAAVLSTMQQVRRRHPSSLSATTKWRVQH